MSNIKKLKKFIKDNKLEFNDGSGGDVNILAICGYACYIEASENELLDAVNTKDGRVEYELTRVLEYASTHDYAKWWKTEQAKKQWKF